MRGLPARCDAERVEVEGMVVLRRMLVLELELELGDEDGGVGGIWARFRLGELVARWGDEGILKLELWHEIKEELEVVERLDLEAEPQDQQ